MPRTKSQQPDRQAGGHSYVVVGTSLGGVSALPELVKNLPRDFPAAVLVVMHIPEKQSKSWLTSKLSDAGHLPVKEAQDGELIRPGQVYIAPPAKHLLVEGNLIRLDEGPRQQHARPAIDALFRSAANAFGPRVIGVILTGMLSDGTIGLRAIKEAGGTTIVQDPVGAEAAQMPANAMKGLGVDYCLPLSQIGPVLDLLVRRAGTEGQGVLETGLAMSVRLLKQRAELLVTLIAQHDGNPSTTRFLTEELATLRREIASIVDMIALAGEPGSEKQD